MNINLIHWDPQVDLALIQKNVFKFLIHKKFHKKKFIILKVKVLAQLHHQD